jgi:hypothetical protein
MTRVLILGSGPEALAARDFPRAAFDRIVVINNAHAVRDDWDDLIHPRDFPAKRLPASIGPGQRLVTEADFVPAQNAYGGFVYAGATMAFTAGYWAMHEYVPSVIAYFGCDMVYPSHGRTHFYGWGEPDPLRKDVTLQSLEAKSARLMIMAAMRGTTVVNLSWRNSRLVFPKVSVENLGERIPPLPWRETAAATALAREARLGYVVPSGRYREVADRFDAVELRKLDMVWLDAMRAPVEMSA